jgi:hypothetical protein
MKPVGVRCLHISHFLAFCGDVHLEPATALSDWRATSVSDSDLRADGSCEPVETIMKNFKYDPEETVRWEGVGDLTLRTAVKRIMASPPENRVLVRMYRDAGKDPPSLMQEEVEWLAEQPEFKAG